MEGEGRRDPIEFLDKYLAHLERKDSREGATKWILIAAMAAVAWQASNVFAITEAAVALKLLALFLLIYYVLERCGEILEPASEDSNSVRFLSRKSSRPAEAKYVSAIATRTAITALLVYFYLGRDVIGDARIFLWVVVAPIALVAAVMYAMLGEVMKEYDVRKKVHFEPWFKGAFFTLFVLPVLIGFYHLFQADAGVRGLLTKDNINAVQLAGLGCALFFLIEKYAKSLRVDGEAVAIRKIWRRNGLGEITDSEAVEQFRLVVAGASLNDVITSDVNAFSSKLQDVEVVITQANEELGKYRADDVELDGVTRRALLNSLKGRAVELGLGTKVLRDLRDDLIAKLKSLLGDAQLADRDAQALKAQIDASVEKVVANSDELVASIAKI